MPLRGRSFRGFPFDEEEGSGAWSELAARHPDIAARLRQRPATWARKRRPSSQDATDDFGDSFSGFDRFPFDDIPPEFREHFPSHWNRRFSERDERSPEPAAPAAPPSPAPPPQQQTAATQTEREPKPEPEQTLPQYGLRNTVDLGQKSPADPSVDADDRTQRSMSAPPDAPHPNMSAHKRPEPAHSPHQESHSNVRHIPIFVEGRDEPVINKNVEHGAQYAEPKQAYQPPPPPPHIDRDQYFAEDGPVGFHHPPNFTRAFGTPFAKGFRQGPQPFVQQKAYPQGAFARGASPQRAQSPKTEEPFVKVPVHREPAAEPQPRAQQRQPPPRQPSPQHQPPPQHQPHQQPPQQPSPPRDATPPPKPQPCANDPIAQILSIQTDVLNLMTEVENFTGTKNDKRYMFLDEMLTRNLIKLDNIETEGKENIRQARKEAIRCIQKCIAVLEAKADSNGANAALMQDVEMKESSENADEPELVAENGEIEIKDPPKEEEKVELQPERIDEPQVKEEIKEDVKREATPKPQEDKTQEPKTEVAPSELVETSPLAANTRPEETKPEEKTDEQKKDVENKPSPKKKVVKKRDKSKDNKEAAKDSNTDLPKDSNKAEVETGEKVEVMQVGDKGDKPMEVGAASQ